MKYGNKFMYLIESAWKKNTTYLTWTVFVYVIKNKHSIILYERNEFCIVEVWKQFYIFDWKYLLEKPNLGRAMFSKKVEILQAVLVLQLASWKKVSLLWAKETAFFPPYFHNGIIFYSAELFECAFNFRFC